MFCPRTSDAIGCGLFCMGRQKSSAQLVPMLQLPTSHTSASRAYVLQQNSIHYNSWFLFYYTDINLDRPIVQECKRFRLWQPTYTFHKSLVYWLHASVINIHRQAIVLLGGIKAVAGTCKVCVIEIPLLCFSRRETLWKTSGVQTVFFLHVCETFTFHRVHISIVILPQVNNHGGKTQYVAMPVPSVTKTSWYANIRLVYESFLNPWLAP